MRHNIGHPTAQFMLTESTNPVATYYAESNMCIKAKK